MTKPVQKRGQIIHSAAPVTTGGLEGDDEVTIADMIGEDARTRSPQRLYTRPRRGKPSWKSFEGSELRQVTASESLRPEGKNGRSTNSSRMVARL